METNKMKFWSLTDLERYFGRSKQSIWAMRKDQTFPAAIEIQGRQMFDSAAVVAWDLGRKKAAAEAEKRRRTEALAQLKAVAK